MLKEKYTILIVDDKLQDTEMLQHLLKRIPYVEVIHGEDDLRRAIKFMDQHQVDILIVDMEMPEMMGWEFVQLLPDPPVVLVYTAHGEYGFEYQGMRAKGYISKLLSWSVLQDAIQDAIHEVDERSRITRNKSTRISLRNAQSKNMEVVELDKIRYAEIDDKVISIALSDREEYLTTIMSLKELMSILPDNRFVRISAKHMVGVRYVTSFNRSTVFLDQQISLDIHDASSYFLLQHYISNDE